MDGNFYVVEVAPRDEEKLKHGIQTISTAVGDSN
jgi:hypothetical protein